MGSFSTPDAVAQLWCLVDDGWQMARLAESCFILHGSDRTYHYVFRAAVSPSNIDHRRSRLSPETDRMTINRYNLMPDHLAVVFLVQIWVVILLYFLMNGSTACGVISFFG
jgi:hypothetical protein